MCRYLAVAWIEIENRTNTRKEDDCRYLAVAWIEIPMDASISSVAMRRYLAVAWIEIFDALLSFFFAMSLPRGSVD